MKCDIFDMLLLSGKALKEGRYGRLITEEDVKRVVEGLATLRERSEILGLSYRQMIRLKKRFISDFNILYFKDKLSELHNIQISYESLRRIMIEEGLHIAKTKNKVYRRRRMPTTGLLVQILSA